MSTLRVLITFVAVCLSLLTHERAIAQSLPPEIHWSYQAATGPEHWAELDPAFATCNPGQDNDQDNDQGQSPINITAAEPADLIDPEFHYHSVPLNLLNNGHTIQVPYAPGSYVILEGDRYNLLQFHFHSPSEHAIDSRLWDAELHLVHQNDSGDLAVVAVLLQTGDPDETATDFEKISDNLPAQKGDKIRTGKTINAQNLLPRRKNTYRYSGSLTTPPCSESVTWLVMGEPVSLPAAQMAQYRKLLNYNNRPLQSRRKRTVQADF